MKDNNVPEAWAGMMKDGSFFRQLCNISRNSLPKDFPQECSLEEAFSLWAEANIPEDRRAHFLQLFSLSALEKAHSAGKSSLAFEYDDIEDPTLSHRLVLHFSEDDETCEALCVGTLSDRPRSSVGPVASSSAENSAMLQAAVQNAVEGLQMEMRMERTEMKRKRRRAVLLFSLFFLILGILSGAILDRKSVAFSSFLDQFFPPDTVEAKDSVEIPEPEVVEIPETVIETAAFAEPVTFTAEIMKNGTARVNTSSESYDTVDFTASVSELLSPSWFEENTIGQGIVLNGTEAAVHLNLSYEAEDPASVNPQDAFSFMVVDNKENILRAYQLTDAPVGGAYGCTLQPGESGSFYKRFDYSEDAAYLILTYYLEGIRHDLYFDLHSVDADAEQGAV